MATDYSELLKADIIVGAYSQLRISGLTTDPTPDDLELALIRLEDMGAEFQSRNMSAGYILENQPDPNSWIGIPREFKYAYETNLAVRLISDFNKQVPATLLAMATQSASNLAARTALQRETPYPKRMPRGSGNSLRFFRWNRFYRQANPDPATTNKLRVGDINNYFEDWSDYLTDFEFIESYVITPDDGLDVTTSQISGNRIEYTVSATDDESTGATFIDIQITTDTGRTDKRRVYFDVSQ